MTSTPRRIGKFEIVERLGEGAMGEVFLARDTLLGREVAIKTIRAALTSPDAKDRFFREAQAAGRLNHPNLVTIHEFGEEDGTLFMVMEYVPGDDLGRLLASRELSHREMLELLAQVCDGLGFAHQRGVLHRDIKPTNIRITRVSGRLAAKVLDFGIARLAGSDLTATGALLGTFGYMAPEYIQSGKPDARADLFAVGVILYETLAGFPPFGGESTATVLHRIVNEEPAPLDPDQLTGISPAIQGVVARALAKDPAARYPSAEALAEALRAARDPWWDPASDKGATRSDRLLDLPQRGRKPAPRAEGAPSHAWIYLAVAAVMAVLTAGAGWLWIRHRRHRPVPAPPVAVQPAAQPVVAPAPPVEAPKPEPPAPEPAKAEPSRPTPAPQAVKAEPKAAPEPAAPARAGAYATLDQAARALDTDPKGALAFLENAVKEDPTNERAIALRIAALYDAGDYRGCSLAIRGARETGHPLWPMALKYPRLRKALEQERITPRLLRRRQAQ
ncbi:serine/threonine-protein kinase [Mesoterricola silvestris]|uniref:Protein kinase domain-containing protein n=1 Tax=Mesoterricola silvestris TaxID=2927979 RepID=A0AA48KBL0_9BACT|nr:serine/threonine-protein kinase [Mesoterricola silvestris]BDU74437.1 hypothetical protein METEAL_36110 [Mesoterricola silvestris]